MRQSASLPPCPRARAGFALAAALARLLRASPGWHWRQSAPVPLAISVQRPCGDWVTVVNGHLHEAQIALALADQQRLHPGRPLRVCRQDTGEVLASTQGGPPARHGRTAAAGIIPRPSATQQ